MSQTVKVRLEDLDKVIVSVIQNLTYCYAGLKKNPLTKFTFELNDTLDKKRSFIFTNDPFSWI